MGRGDVHPSGDVGGPLDQGIRVRRGSTIPPAGGHRRASLLAETFLPPRGKRRRGWCYLKRRGGDRLESANGRASEGNRDESAVAARQASSAGSLDGRADAADTIPESRADPLTDSLAGFPAQARLTSRKDGTRAATREGQARLQIGR